MVRPIARYFFASGATGAVGGIFHGYTRGSLELFRDTGSFSPVTQQHTLTYLVPAVTNDALKGALLGPWLPIWVPLSLTLWRNQSSCPHFRALK